MRRWLLLFILSLLALPAEAGRLQALKKEVRRSVLTADVALFTAWRLVKFPSLCLWSALSGLKRVGKDAGAEAKFTKEEILLEALGQVSDIKQHFLKRGAHYKKVFK